GVHERHVGTGLSNDFAAEVTAGLTAGDLVLRDPRALAGRLGPLLGRAAKPPASGEGKTPVPPGAAIPGRSGQPARRGPGARRPLAAAYGLTYEDLQRFAALPSVTALVPVRAFPQEVRRLQHLYRGQVVATTADYAEQTGLAPASGRFLTADDDHEMR